MPLLRRLQAKDKHGDGTCVFAFVSPEKVARSAALHACLREAYELGVWRKGVFDEAHCIDEQGHEFRPDFLVLGALRVAFPELRFMCLTATAPPEVLVSLSLTLGIADPVVLRSPLKRAQMAYTVRVIASERLKVRLVRRIVRDARSHGESTLVYTNTRRGTVELAAQLCEECNLPVGTDSVQKPGEIEAYHAGMTGVRRRELEACWRTSRTRVMAATTAMGMGMDKPDLDRVMHHQLPRSVAALYQEASRAGRDGRRGSWDGVFTMADVFDQLERRSGKIAASAAGHEYGVAVVRDLLRFLLDTETCRHILFERALGAGLDEPGLICGAADASEPQCDNCRRGCADASSTVVREAWIPALLHLAADLASSSDRPLTLRALAAAWLRCADAPKPRWVRPALFLLALLSEVFSLSFIAVARAHDTSVSPVDAPEQRPPVSWSVRVSIDSRGRSVARESAALASVRLPAALWDASAAEEALDEIAFDELAQEVEAGDACANGPNSDLDSDWDSDALSEGESDHESDPPSD